ncbi:hypothetical protein SLEP1_g23468 [Rubroshorea leprosula]|uniref:RING-type E3 ubiquitin transferase n=1 Tax=Rubroshorea leprosula TaxID=152421 RepID=A0AAV5JHP7_9ROSI|nr:hypothetical protein SLEP1_g23468 [Rubroshorea leprosula]
MSENDTEPADCCLSSTSSTVPPELKLYQAFVFSVPIFFTFILLFLFYMFYLRRQEVDWSSLLMRTSAELGLKKEVREMLPIIIYKESFSIKDTQCSVCLGDYLAEDKLQQIPACSHTFHMECIDHWLANHRTCPLCRLSVLASPKASSRLPDINAANGQDLSNPESSIQIRSQTEVVHPSEPTSGDVRIFQSNSKEIGRTSQCVNQGREFRDNETGEHDHGGGISEHGQESSDPENSGKSFVKPMSLTCEATQAIEQMEPKTGDVRILPNGEEEGRISPQDNQGREFRDTKKESNQRA